MAIVLPSRASRERESVCELSVCLRRSWRMETKTWPSFTAQNIHGVESELTNI